MSYKQKKLLIVYIYIYIYSVGRHGFADDAQMQNEFDLSCKTSFKSALLSIENCCLDVNHWMIINRLKLNCDKTEYIVYGTNYFFKKIGAIPDLQVCGNIVKVVQKVRNLGAICDKTLNMKLQINDVVKKGTYTLRAIRRIRKFVPFAVLKSLVVMLVISRIDFVNGLYTNLSKFEIHRLDVLLNNAARLITFTSRYVSITPVLKDLHWLRVEYRVKYKCCIYVHKSLYNPKVPAYIKNMFVKQNYIRCTRLSKDFIRIVIPKVKTKVGEKCFQIVAIKSWNCLPIELRMISNNASFKRNLKTFLFRQCFS